MRFWLIAKVAVTVMLPVTFASVRVAVATVSDQLTKW
jgi:hypothetical protein